MLSCGVVTTPTKVQTFLNGNVTAEDIHNEVVALTGVRALPHSFIANREMALAA